MPRAEHAGHDRDVHGRTLTKLRMQSSVIAPPTGDTESRSRHDPDKFSSFLSMTTFIEDWPPGDWYDHNVVVVSNVLLADGTFGDMASLEG